MENEKRLVEIMAELLIKFDEFIDEQKVTNSKLQSMDNRLESVDNRLEKVELQIIKLNLVSNENTRAIFKLAEEVENIAKLHERVTNLEKAVYK